MHVSPEGDVCPAGAPAGSTGEQHETPVAQTQVPNIYIHLYLVYFSIGINFFIDLILTTAGRPRNPDSREDYWPTD